MPRLFVLHFALKFEDFLHVLRSFVFFRCAASFQLSELVTCDVKLCHLLMQWRQVDYVSYGVTTTVAYHTVESHRIDNVHAKGHLKTNNTLTERTHNEFAWSVLLGIIVHYSFGQRINFAKLSTSTSRQEKPLEDSKEM